MEEQKQEQESKRKVIKEKFNRFRRKGEKQPNYSYYRNLTEKDLLHSINRELKKNNKYLKSIDYILHLLVVILVFVIIMFVIVNHEVPLTLVEIFLNTLYHLLV